MKRTVLALTAPILLASPARAELSTEEAVQELTEAAIDSAKSYCNLKDRGAKEGVALSLARAEFELRFGKAALAAPSQINKTMTENPEVERKYQKMFNIYAYKNCPEYFNKKPAIGS